MVITKGFFSKTHKCDWCGYSSKDKNETIIHEETCTSGPSVNPLSIIEYTGCTTADVIFDDSDYFREFEEINEKLAKYKDYGWIIHRKADSGYGIQWLKSVSKDYVVIVNQPPAKKFQSSGVISIFECIVNGDVAEQKWDVSFEESIELAIKWITELNPEYTTQLEHIENKKIETKKKQAMEREEALDYDSAIQIWEEIGEINEAARVRKLQAEMGSVKVAQSVVQGDQITKTEIKDSVLNRSNVGSGSSKMQELEKLTEMKEKGLIDDDEFKQMKKEILGK